MRNSSVEKLLVKSDQYGTLLKRARSKYGIKKLPKVAHFSFEGNFTICVILPSKGKTPAAIGIAKRNPTDKYSPETGKKIALMRALESLGEQEVGGDDC